MSRASFILEKVFGGYQSPFTRILLQEGDGSSPDGTKVAPKGTWLIIQYPLDPTDGDIYLNTDGSTTWLQVYNAN